MSTPTTATAEQTDAATRYIEKLTRQLAASRQAAAAMIPRTRAELARALIAVERLQAQVSQQKRTIADLADQVKELRDKLPKQPETRVIHLYNELREAGPPTEVNIACKGSLVYTEASPAQENAIRVMEGD